MILFKSGDKVQCIDADVADDLVYGSIYTIQSATRNGEFVYLKEVPKYMYDASRF